MFTMSLLQRLAIAALFSGVALALALWALAGGGT